MALIHIHENRALHSLLKQGEAHLRRELSLDLLIKTMESCLYPGFRVTRGLLNTLAELLVSGAPYDHTRGLVKTSPNKLDWWIKLNFGQGELFEDTSLCLLGMV